MMRAQTSQVMSAAMPARRAVVSVPRVSGGNGATACVDDGADADG